ncbi:hypothetical protein H1R20_g11733, partial [Candolleomyces eurysporus]
MENPAKDIHKIFNLIDCAHSPELQKAAIEKYFLPDAGLKYPVFQVERGPGGRDRILKLYQYAGFQLSTHDPLSESRVRWLHIVSPKTKGVITHVVYDKSSHALLLDVTQHLDLIYLPFWKSTSRMLTRLSLEKHGGLQYIAFQEDFMHPDDLAGLLLPPMKTVLQTLLWMVAIFLTVLAMVAQFLGIFAVRKRREDDIKGRRRERRRKNKNGTDTMVSDGTMQEENGKGKEDGQKEGVVARN